MAQGVWVRMRTVVRIGPDFTLKIPEELQPFITPGDEWLVSLVGGTLVCQRLAERDEASRRLGEVMQRAEEQPDPDAPSTEEMEAIIDQVRRQPL